MAWGHGNDCGFGDYEGGRIGGWWVYDCPFYGCDLLFVRFMNEQHHPPMLIMSFPPNLRDPGTALVPLPPPFFM